MKPEENLFMALDKINTRPRPFEFYTAADLWTHGHRSGRMLEFQLNETLDVASRNKAFIQKSIEFICSGLGVGPGTRIADFGCGPGLYANGLARQGALVTGIDFSKNSLDHAANTAAGENLPACYVHENYLDWETEQRFDLILMIMCDFCALSPEQRAALLGKFHGLLDPGGAVLLDVYSLNAFEQIKETAEYGFDLLDGFWSEEPYFGFLNRFKYQTRRLVLDQYAIVRPAGTAVVYNWLQYFSPQSLDKEFNDRGFEIEGRYADVAGSPFSSQGLEFAVFARKN